MRSNLPDSVKDLIFPITCTYRNNAGSNTLGTGFIIHKDDLNIYLLTCAHVVNPAGDANNREIKTRGISLNILALGEVNGFDLAVLSLAKSTLESQKTVTFDKVPFDLYPFGEVGRKVWICGWHQEVKTTFESELHGTLGQRIRIVSENQEDETSGWYLTVDTDSPNQLVEGFSGSPVIGRFDRGYYALGIVAIEKGTQQGIAFSIEALEKVWKDMPQNILQFNLRPIESPKPELPESLRQSIAEMDNRLIQIMHYSLRIQNELQDEENPHPYLFRNWSHNKPESINDGVYRNLRSVSLVGHTNLEDKICSLTKEIKKKYTSLLDVTDQLGRCIGQDMNTPKYKSNIELLRENSENLVKSCQELRGELKRIGKHSDCINYSRF